MNVIILVAVCLRDHPRCAQPNIRSGEQVWGERAFAGPNTSSYEHTAGEQTFGAGVAWGIGARRANYHTPASPVGYVRTWRSASDIALDGAAGVL